MTKLLRQIRILTVIFIIALVLSGVTAFPLYEELKWLIKANLFSQETAIYRWLYKVWIGVSKTHEDYPFIFYGFDWLGYAHLMIAIAFIGVYQHPVRNRWIVDWGMICCSCVLPLAFIAGFVRGIPLFHRIIDCSFGIVGIIPLLILKSRIKKLAELKNKSRQSAKSVQQ